MLDEERLFAAERLLIRQFSSAESQSGSSIRLTQVGELRAGRVVRCRVDGVSAHPSAIVKVAEPGVDAFRNLATIHNEQTALELLAEHDPGRSPALLAADPRAGILIMEDLGDHESLATALLADTPSVARVALRETASALGEMQAATVGLADRFATRRRALSPWDAADERLIVRGRDMRQCLRDLPDLLAANNLPPPSGVDAEFDSLLDELRDPGDLLAFSGGDPCPDNQLRTPDGLRFIDFEAATFRHALIDATHFLLPFPNCWCWAPLPDAETIDALAVHRAALATSSRSARDDARYGEALARTAAVWVLWTLARRVPVITDEEAAGDRLLIACDRFLRLTDAETHLPKFAAYCQTLGEVCGARWGRSVDDVVAFPAYGGPARS